MNVVICSPIRTPVGRMGGCLAPLTGTDLASQALQALLARSGLDPERVDNVVLGHGYPGGEAPAIGRVVHSMRAWECRCRAPNRPTVRVGPASRALCRRAGRCGRSAHHHRRRYGIDVQC